MHPRKTRIPSPPDVAFHLHGMLSPAPSCLRARACRGTARVSIGHQGVKYPLPGDIFVSKAWWFQNKAISLHSEIRQRLSGAVVQLVRILACHARGRGFESRPHRRGRVLRNSPFFCLCARTPMQTRGRRTGTVRVIGALSQRIMPYVHWLSTQHFYEPSIKKTVDFP